MNNRRTFPFAAVAGLELAKRALLLLAVEPKLKGVLITAPPGTGKTTLVHSFRSLIPGLPFVSLPLGVTADRLVGGLDLEKTCIAGSPHWNDGLLRQADGGFLFVDHLNLLDPEIAAQIGIALAHGRISIEREGLSRTVPTKFNLIGTLDPDEGSVSNAVSSRTAIIVTEHEPQNPANRLEVMESAFFHKSDPDGFAAKFEAETERIRAAIMAARLRMPRVRISRKQAEFISLSALGSGVEGNAVDVFATYAACANAALDGRACVDTTDLEMAFRLVIAPRATVSSDQPGEARPWPQKSPHENPQKNMDGQADPSPDAGSQDLQISAIDTRLPKGLPRELIDSQGRRTRSRKPGSRGELMNRSRGRYVSASTDRADGARVAIDATLRAAAPRQSQRSKQSNAFHIEPSDLRYKRFKRKAGALFIFVVDASGSMAINRMHQAKGAILRLLKDAYLNRDRVAMISFRGRSAEVLLPPTQSVERARRMLESLPVGGGTPLAAGLKAAILLSDKHPESVIVLLTDGRANVASSGEVRSELERLGIEVQRRDVDVLVIDTQARFTARGEALDIARMLGGNYFYLPHDDGSRLYRALRT